MNGLSVFFIPSESTLYMIGASQVAEVAIQTEEMGKVRTIINDKLDSMLEGTTKAVKEVE